MKNPWKLLFVLSLMVGSSFGQMHQVRSVSILPATCNPGGGTGGAQADHVDLWTGIANVPYYCKASNVWAVVGSGLPVSGLTAAYDMTDSGTSTLTDSSGNGNNGTFPGSSHNPSRVTSGSADIGLTFAGSSSQYISLPSALNSCQTYLFAYNLPAWTVTTSDPTAAFVAQASAQGGGSVYAIGFMTNANIPQIYNMALYDYSGGAGSTAVQNSGLGTHVVIFSSGNGSANADHIYMDGRDDTQYYSVASPSSTINNGSSNWQLGGASTFSAYFTGAMYYAACWNRQLSTAEVGQANSVIATVLNQRGIQAPISGLTTAASGGQDSIVCDGDSIMYGAQDIGLGTGQFCANMVLTNATAYNIFIPATAASTIINQIYPNGWAVDNFYVDGASRNIVLQNGGHNDSGSTAQIVGATAGYCRDRRKIGWRCGIVTEVSNGGSNDTRTAYLRQHWREYSDFLVDWAGDPTIGCNSCSTSFVGPHPNVWETYAMQQYYTQRAINRVAGPQDLNSATIYTTGATAATAPTAITDGAQLGSTGMSIATYTFSSNPFASMGPQGNGVGVEVTCTGTTPAGYSTTFITASSTSTAITGVIPTDSLSNATGFGTCTAPQIEDQFFVINNASVGTYTIGTACAFTGQRITFKNIGAGTATVDFTSMPNESAETADGSSSITATQYQTRILEATFSSPASPQCGWKVIQ